MLCWDKKIIYRGRYLNLIWLQLSARYLSTIRSTPLRNTLDDRDRGTSCPSAKKSNIRKVLLASSGQSIGRDPSAIPIVNVIANLTLCACWWHTWYLSFFYTHTFSGLKILHSKVRKFATKIASRQMFRLKSNWNVLLALVNNRNRKYWFCVKLQMKN